MFAGCWEMIANADSIPKSSICKFSIHLSVSEIPPFPNIERLKGLLTEVLSKWHEMRFPLNYRNVHWQYFR